VKTHSKKHQLWNIRRLEADLTFWKAATSSWFRFIVSTFSFHTKRSMDTFLVWTCIIAYLPRTFTTTQAFSREQ